MTNPYAQDVADMLLARMPKLEAHAKTLLVAQEAVSLAKQDNPSDKTKLKTLRSIRDLQSQDLAEEIADIGFIGSQVELPGGMIIEVSNKNVAKHTTNELLRKYKLTRQQLNRLINSEDALNDETMQLVIDEFGVTAHQRVTIKRGGSNTA